MKVVEPYSFSLLVDVHTAIEDVFLAHQEALTLLDIGAARELLEIHGRLLELHMGHEEELLIPVFERAGRIAKWPTVLFTGQHRKMLGMLASVPHRLAELASVPSQRRRREMLRILDHETTYKHLVEHHEGAEREGLFPIADRSMESDERRALLEHMRDEWSEAFARERPRLDAIRQGTLAQSAG
jgi:hypothetical protein